MTQKILKAIFYIAIGLLLSFAFVKVAAVGLDRQEEYECQKWQQWAKDYPLFYLTRWQADQCEAHGIKVEAPVLGGEKITAPITAETLNAKVYAFSSTETQTDGNPIRMASGKDVYDGAVACPSRYAFGTHVEIAGKVYTCEDRMAPKYRDGNNFDVWMPSYEKAREWGVQNLTVKILK
jgi:3D (Asp-Asp-Asp) domain-containing protein